MYAAAITFHWALFSDDDDDDVAARARAAERDTGALIDVTKLS
jgi:hypothetical protein